MIEILENPYIALLLIPILVGILEAIKKADFINTKYMPLISIVLGIGIGIVFTEFAIKDGIIAGLFIGLSAVGLFSGQKNIREGMQDK